MWHTYIIMKKCGRGFGTSMSTYRLLAAFFVAILGICILSTYAPRAHAALTLTAGDSATTTPSVATSITGFQIVGPAASTTPVKLRATNGTLTLSSVSGVTMSGNNSSTVNLSGTVEKLNTALSTLTYTRGSTGTDTLEVSLVEPTEVFFETNGHLYKYISGSYNWAAAETAAEGQELYGSTGYLATITSEEENEFVYTRISGNGWLGTNDIETEKTWKWVTGPEAGTAYFQESPTGGGGSAIGGRFHGWASGEPNDYSPGEDCGYMYASQDGEWNDFPCSASQGYVVEFGADGDLPTVVAVNISIVTADVPAVTTLSPANGATSVSPTANLVLGFSKNVTAGTGNILIKKSSDDSTIATISVTGDEVSGSGTNSITINPSTALPEGTELYVTVPGTAFVDGSDNPFDGISDDTTWVFTTSDETAPTLSAQTATPAATSAAIAWTTSESASTKVSYGLTSSYSTSTLETDTSPRVTSHEVTLSNLLSCTIYHYAVVSRDATGNSATSTDATFTTTGCTSDAAPTAATSTPITTTSGGSSTLTDSSKTFTVTAPANATASSSSFVIQVKSIPSTNVLTTIGRPASAPNEVGATVFDVKAIIDGTTILDSFDAEVTIDYEYTDLEVVGLDEASLWLYHYTGGQWVALNNCTVNTAANTISCTTPSFSIFGLFGTNPSSNSYGYVAIDAQIRELLAQNEFFKALGLTQQYPEYMKQHLTLHIEVLKAVLTHLLGSTPAVAASPIRDLELTMEGSDVRQLQELLLANGYSIAAGATGYFGSQTQQALAAYQKEKGIAPALGYFGSMTRAQMKAAALTELWW